MVVRRHAQGQAVSAPHQTTDADFLDKLRRMAYELYPNQTLGLTAEEWGRLSDAMLWDPTLMMVFGVRVAIIPDDWETADIWAAVA